MFCGCLQQLRRGLPGRWRSSQCHPCCCRDDRPCVLLCIDNIQSENSSAEPQFTQLGSGICKNSSTDMPVPPTGNMRSGLNATLNACMPASTSCDRPLLTSMAMAAYHFTRKFGKCRSAFRLHQRGFTNLARPCHNLDESTRLCQTAAQNLKLGALAGH